MLRTTITAAALALLAAACTSDSTEPAPIPATGETVSAAQQQLAALARKAAAASYDATYDFDAKVTGGKGAIRIVAMPPSYRVDVISGGNTAQFFDTTDGVVSCAVKRGQPTTCLLVATQGQPVPEVFDPGVQHLFTTGPAALSSNPEGYDVRSLPDAPPAGDVPGGKCFHVERLADLQTVSPGTVTPAGEGFETGDYCFDETSGVLVSAKVTSGTLTLAKLGPKPTAKDFEPPAKPVPLPSGTAQPMTTPPSS